MYNKPEKVCGRKSIKWTMHNLVTVGIRIDKIFFLYRNHLGNYVSIVAYNTCEYRYFCFQNSFPLLL